MINFFFLLLDSLKPENKKEILIHSCFFVTNLFKRSLEASYFHGYKSCNGNYKQEMLIPYNRDKNHWSLVHYKDGVIFHFDSYYQSCDTNTIDKIKNYIFAKKIVNSRINTEYKSSEHKKRVKNKEYKMMETNILKNFVAENLTNQKLEQERISFVKSIEIKTSLPSKQLNLVDCGIFNIFFAYFTSTERKLHSLKKIFPN